MCKYRYYCPIDGYKGNNPHYFHMRNNSDGHSCFPVDNPDYNGKCEHCGDCDYEDQEEEEEEDSY